MGPLATHDRRSEVDELRKRLRQQAAVADVGRRALAGLDLCAVIREAVKVISAELGAPLVSAFEASEAQRSFVYRDGAGLSDTRDEPFPLHGTPSQMGYAFRSAEPVLVSDLVREERFRASRALLEEGARSSLSVRIGTAETPFGVLVASSRRVHDFTEDDASFLQSMANTVAAVAEREQTQGAILSEHRRVAAALAHVSESEARFREMADDAPVFIWTADAAGMIDFTNRGWIEFTGRTREEELGDTWRLGVHPEDAEAVESSWWRAHRRRTAWEREYRLRRHDGAYRWIVDRGVPRFAGHRLVGWVGTAIDIHERKEMEVKLAAAAARDHEVAETLQRSLLPERLPHIDGVALEARYLPAARGTAIGGDWYDAIALDDGRVAVVVGDVVGHGLRAATVMGQMRNAFRAYALVESSPGATLSRLNRLLAKDETEAMATALYVILDRDTGQLVFSSAGHPPALVLGAGTARYLEGGRSVPLGTSEFAPYRDATAQIEPGSTLLLYTDGLVERRDTPLDDRLTQLRSVASVAGGELGDVCDQILGGILGGLNAPDDVALLAVRPEAVPEGALLMRLAADPASLAPLRRRLGRFLATAGASEAERFDITLCVSEAAMNAIEHAYGPADAEFEVQGSEHAGLLTVTVRDRGSWQAPRNHDGDRGRGLGIMRELMDEVELTPGRRGTSVRLSRRLAGARRRSGGQP